MAYLLDTDTFIFAKNYNYGFDFCPAYWDFLLQGNEAGVIYSVQKVQEELCPKNTHNDELATWSQREGASLFLPFDQNTSVQAVKIANYVANLPTPPYKQKYKDDFLDGGDFALVACAKAYNHVVVTREKFKISDPNLTHVKIPNVCSDFGITCITPFEMLRMLGARFILAPKEENIFNANLDSNDGQDKEDLDTNDFDDEDYEV